MYTNFLEDLIYKYNPKLEDGNLKILDTLSHLYNIEPNLVFNYSINSIVSRLILNELPYKLAQKYTFDGHLMQYLVEFRTDRFVSLCDDDLLVSEHVRRINNLLQNES